MCEFAQVGVFSTGVSHDSEGRTQKFPRKAGDWLRLCWRSHPHADALPSFLPACLA